MTSYTPLSGKAAKPTDEFDIEESGTITPHQSVLQRYYAFLQKYQYPILLRVFLYLWYIVYLYVIILVIGYRHTTISSFTMVGEDSNTSWLPVVKTVLNLAESISPGSTNHILENLPGKLPFGQTTFYIHHFGICKEDQNLERICYSGENVLRVLSLDVAIQAAELKGTKTSDFRSQWEERYNSILEAVSASVERHTVCGKRLIWNLFFRKCIVKDVDASALAVFREFANDTYTPMRTKHWMLASFLFFVVVLLDLYGIFVTANEKTFKVVWRVLFFANYFTLWLYILSLLTPKYSILSDTGISFVDGNLGYVTVGLMILQMWYAMSAALYHS